MKTTERMPEIEYILKEEIRKSTDYHLLIVSEDGTTATYLETRGLNDAFNFIDDTIDNLEEFKEIRVAEARNILKDGSIDSNIRRRRSRNVVNRLFSPFGGIEVGMKNVDEIINKLEELRERLKEEENVYYAFKINEDYSFELLPIDICTTAAKYLTYNVNDGKLNFSFKNVEVFGFIIDSSDNVNLLNMTTDGKECEFFDESYPNGERFLSYMRDSYLLVRDEEKAKKAIEDISCWFVCKNCRTPFHVSSENLRWYMRRGLETPKRCNACRQSRKIAKMKAAGYDVDNNDDHDDGYYFGGGFGY